MGKAITDLRAVAVRKLLIETLGRPYSSARNKAKNGYRISWMFAASDQAKAIKALFSSSIDVTGIKFVAEKNTRLAYLRVYIPINESPDDPIPPRAKPAKAVKLVRFTSRTRLGMVTITDNNTGNKARIPRHAAAAALVVLETLFD